MSQKFQGYNLCNSQTGAWQGALAASLSHPGLTVLMPGHPSTNKPGKGLGSWGTCRKGSHQLLKQHLSPLTPLPRPDPRAHLQLLWNLNFVYTYTSHFAHCIPSPWEQSGISLCGTLNSQMLNFPYSAITNYNLTATLSNVSSLKYKLMNCINSLIKDICAPHRTLVKNIKIQTQDSFVEGHHESHVEIFGLWRYFLHFNEKKIS